MNWHNEVYRGFSCPQEVRDLRLQEMIAVEYARGYTNRFIEKFDKGLREKGNGLVPVLASWLKEEGSLETVWDHAFGETRKAVFNSEAINYPQCAAALGLRLHQCGLPGEWRISMSDAVRLRWQQWLLPSASQIQVDASSDYAVIKARGPRFDSEIRLWRDGTEWNAEGATLLPVVSAGSVKLTLLLREALASVDFDEIRTIACDDFSEDAAQAYTDALTILHRNAPIYSSWIGQVIRHVIPVQFEEAMIRSGSLADQRGIIHMSVYAQPVAIAEMLVHEAAHQYFSMATQLATVDDGTDKNLYYSSVRRMDRPLRYILFAYHAFANVLLFYRLCQQSDLDDEGYCYRNEESLLPQLAQLQSTLEGARALTLLGRGLWEPLAERIKL